MFGSQLQRLRQSSLAQNSAWMLGGQGLSFVIQGAYFVVLARLLGSSQYGLLAGAWALIALVSQYSTLGSGPLFVRYVSADRSRFAEYWGNAILSTLCLGGVLVLAVTFLAPLIVRSTPVRVVFLLAVSDCLCGQLTGCAGQVFQTFEQMRLTAGLNLMISTFRLTAALALLFTVRHATAEEWAVVTLLVSLLALVVATASVTRRFGRPSLRPTLLRRHAREGLSFAISGSTTSAYNDLDKAMLAHYGMSAANGAYTMAYRVVDICSVPIRSIHAAAFARFFRVGTEGVHATETLARRILKRTSLLGVVAAIAMFAGAPLLPALTGRSFGPSVAALRWLCLIPFFRAFHLGAGDALAGAGFQRYRTTYQAGAAGLNFVLNVVFIPRYSFLGAAWASLLTDGLLGVVSWATLLWTRRQQDAERTVPAVQLAEGIA